MVEVGQRRLEGFACVAAFYCVCLTSPTSQPCSLLLNEDPVPQPRRLPSFLLLHGTSTILKYTVYLLMWPSSLLSPKFIEKKHSLIHAGCYVPSN